MTNISELIESCPCDVVFGEWPDVNYGMCDYDPFCYIRIQESRPQYQQEAVLAHEIGHARCKANKCGCMQNTGAAREYRAQKFALTWLLKHENKPALSFLIDIIEEVLEDNPDSAHGLANKRIMKLKLWEKCKKFVDS